MKLLVSLWTWYLLLQVGGMLVVYRRARGGARLVAGCLLITTALIGLLSTPLAHEFFEAAITPSSISTSGVSPTIIFVLGGGYRAGGTPEEDVLNDESERRVAHAVSVWQRFRSAHLVMSGAAEDNIPPRQATRLGQLMTAAARNRLVPPTALATESRSLNTREHPIEALALPGVTPSVPVGIVTSGWHMRRAQREFCRYFLQVQTYPVPPDLPQLRWPNFIPNAGSLDANTTLLRELVGSLVYSVGGASGSQKCSGQ